MIHPLFLEPQNFINIPGPMGDLESIVAPPAIECSPIVVIVCHPHPLHGGTMQNKVVTTLGRAFYDLGLWNIRFNFRGVGGSQGQYDQGKGEMNDLLSVIQWTQKKFPQYHIWLAGFSFGAYVAIQAAIHPQFEEQIKQLITVAPAVNHFDLPNDKEVHCPWLLIGGEKDEIVPIEIIKEWVKRRNTEINAIYLPDVGHFFHHHLMTLREQLKAALKKCLKS